MRAPMRQSPWRQPRMTWCCDESLLRIEASLKLVLAELQYLVWSGTSVSVVVSKGWNMLAVHRASFLGTCCCTATPPPLPPSPTPRLPQDNWLGSIHVFTDNNLVERHILVKKLLSNQTFLCRWLVGRERGRELMKDFHLTGKKIQKCSTTEDQT